jgi:transposase-like protein
MGGANTPAMRMATASARSTSTPWRGSGREGFWSLLRSWLRPHRGISQDKLPLYLGFFAFVHNARRRGKALLGALVAALVM